MNDELPNDEPYKLQRRPPPKVGWTRCYNGYSNADLEPDERPHWTYEKQDKPEILWDDVEERWYFVHFDPEVGFFRVHYMQSCYPDAEQAYQKDIRTLTNNYNNLRESIGYNVPT